MASVLLLEPDAILGSTYAQALSSAGHAVTHKRTAQEALHDIDRSSVDLVITELQLALHNGIEFLYEFRSYYEWKNIPVIVLSSISPANTAIGRYLWKHLKISTYHYKPATKLGGLIDSVEQILSK